MVNKYRLFCTTESNFFNVWSDEVPTLCPNNGNHIIDGSTVTLIDSFDNSSNSVRPSDYSISLINYTGIPGKSSFRDIMTTSTNAQINNKNQSIEMLLTGAGQISMSTTIRGYYDSACVNFSMQLSNISTSNQEVKLGYFDDSNGYYYLINGSSYGCWSMRNGASNLYATKSVDNTYFQDWAIFYRPRQVAYFLSDNLIVDTYTPPDKTPPFFLPLRIDLKSSTSNVDSSVNLASRSYNIKQVYPVEQSWRRLALDVKSPVPSKGSFTPILSLRRKAGQPAQTILKLYEFEVLCKSDVILEIRMGASLEGTPMFQDVSLDESVVEYDSSATACTGGLQVWCGYASSIIQCGIQFGDQLLTFCCQSVSTASGTVSIAPRWYESW